MSEELNKIFEKVKLVFGVEDKNISDINMTNNDGENALHLAVRWEAIEAVKLLLREGININQPGDLGHTPLHEACSIGNLEITKILVENGADLFALTEGNPPFTLARFSGSDHICDYLAIEMKKTQEQDPHIWVRARIKQLKAEIQRLESRLETSS
ncbi:MAG: ankyrin repeat domain-containing protein [Candidatus Saccharibacteria bacterium]|nr:ankyrin repeat domain-containing protein [Moraxellaceae bacterium]